MNFTIRRAERRQAKLRLALTGVSGCGKSLGAINIASGMNKKFIVIDTEHKSADLYANVAEFDVLTLDKPFTPDKYIQAINYCEKQGYEVIIIDSLSHAWAGEGGALDMHDAATQASASKNSYLAWKDVTPWINKLINAIIQSPSHIITTLRVKTHHDLVDVGGKKKPVKIGLAPIQKDGLEYEFTTVLNLDKDSYLYTSSKDRTGIFEGKHERLSKETGEQLIEWLNSGKSNEQVEQEEIESIANELSMALTLEALRVSYANAIHKFPKMKDKFLSIANVKKQEFESVQGEIH